jgi:hypothetical protein
LVGTFLALKVFQHNCLWVLRVSLLLLFGTEQCAPALTAHVLNTGREDLTLDLLLHCVALSQVVVPPELLVYLGRPGDAIVNSTPIAP